MNYKQLNALGVLILLATVGAVVTYDEVSIAHFQKDIYPLQQVCSYANLAEGSSNLTQIAGYFNDSLGLLTTFHGNPSWIYPTYGTSFLYLKQIISQDRNQSISYSHTKNLTGINYNLYLNNVHNAAHKIVNIVPNMIYWEQVSPFYFGISIAYIVMMIAVPFLFIGFEIIDNDILRIMVFVLFLSMIANGIYIVVL